jgi:hypothetical protein
VRTSAEHVTQGAAHRHDVDTLPITTTAETMAGGFYLTARIGDQIVWTDYVYGDRWDQEKADAAATLMFANALRRLLDPEYAG